MESELTDEQRQLAIDAKRFLEDPVCPKVLDAVVRSVRKELEESAFHEVELREDCYRQLRAVREFHKQLTTLAVKGKLALVRQQRSNGGDSSAA